MERIFFRSMQDSKAAKTNSSYRIGVTGLGQGVGTTFVATALAFYFRDQGYSVSFTECLQPASCRSLYYDQVAMDKRFAYRRFEDIYQRLQEEGPLSPSVNHESGIIWRLPTPDNCKSRLQLTAQQQTRLVTTGREEVCIFDMETDYSWDDFLVDMDVIFVVTDPLPSKLIRSRERYRVLKKMELSGCRMIWIVYKTNDGIDKKQVKNYLKADKVYWLEAFSAATVYEDEYLCRFHWENEEIQRKMTAIFTKVSRIHGSLSWFSISKDVEI